MEIAERPDPLLKLRRCILCGQNACNYELELDQNTGMIVSRSYRKFKGNMCRNHAKRLFTRVQIHNLFLGWWGTISFMVTAAYLLSNTGRYIKFLSVARKASV